MVGEVTVEGSSGYRTSNGSIEYPNPMNRLYFLSYLLSSIFAILLGLMVSNDRPDKALLGMVLLWSIGLFFLTGILWKEIIHRPLSVTISDDGLLLHLRFGRLVRIEWSDIL